MLRIATLKEGGKDDWPSADPISLLYTRARVYVCVCPFLSFAGLEQGPLMQTDPVEMSLLTSLGIKKKRRRMKENNGLSVISYAKSTVIVPIVDDGRPSIVSRW